MAREEETSELLEDEYDEEDDYEEEDDYYDDDDDEEIDESKGVIDKSKSEHSTNMDAVGVKIKSGDKVKIVGSCKLTHKFYTLSGPMKRFLNKDDLHRVQSVRGSCVQVCRYSWHAKDLLVIPNKIPKKEKYKKEKFDPTNLDI
jgi:hypothetical protein